MAVSALTEPSVALLHERVTVVKATGDVDKCLNKCLDGFKQLEAIMVIQLSVTALRSHAVSMMATDDDNIGTQCH